MVRPPRSVSAAVLLLALILPALADAQAAPDGDIPFCDDEAQTEWMKQRREQLGVQVSEPSMNLMPSALPGDLCMESVNFSEKQEGRATDGIHSWVMAAGCKLALCGTPQTFERNTAGAWLTGEFDLNNNILPETSHIKDLINARRCFPEPPSKSHLRTRGAAEEDRAVAPAKDYPNMCFAETETIHAEITPPHGLRKYLREEWRPEMGAWLSWTRRMAEDKVCMYGPFVADTGHGAKAEIHPIQMVWWNGNLGRKTGKSFGEKDAFGPDGPYFLLLIEDASSRYVKPQDFVLNRPTPAEGTWRPWAQAPLPGRFEIPFWVRSDQPADLLIEPMAGTGKEVRPLVPPLRVTECGEIRTLATTVNIARDVDVKTEVLCRRRTAPDEPPRPCPSPAPVAPSALSPAPVASAAPQYLARLVVSGSVGRDREWEEGYFGLKVTDARQPSSFRNPSNEPAAVCNSTLGLQALVTWRPDPAAPFHAADERTLAARQRVKEITEQMFESAGWPKGRPHPSPVLLKIGAARLEPRVAVPCLREKVEAGIKLHVTWQGAEACDASGEDCVPLTNLQDLPHDGQRVAFDWTDDLLVRQATVDFHARAEVPAETPTDRPQILEKDFHTTIWTHAFRAFHADQKEWVEAAAQLCQQSTGLGTRAIANKTTTRVTPAGWLPPSQEIQALTMNITADEVVTMTELRTLVDEIGRFCGRTTRLRR